MSRTLIGAAVGGLVGVLLLGSYAAVEGFAHGGELLAKPEVPPGWYAAALTAFVAVAYFWWAAVAVGVWVGGLLGLGSAALRSWRQKSR